MYRLVVEELGLRRRSLAVAVCRISALSTADYCLGRRKETGRGSFVWRGSARDIRRLFEAERLGEAWQEAMEEDKEYAVRFLTSLARCA